MSSLLGNQMVTYPMMLLDAEWSTLSHIFVINSPVFTISGQILSEIKIISDPIFLKTLSSTRIMSETVNWLGHINLFTLSEIKLCVLSYAYVYSGVYYVYHWSSLYRVSVYDIVIDVGHSRVHLRTFATTYRPNSSDTHRLGDKKYQSFMSFAIANYQ